MSLTRVKTSVAGGDILKRVTLAELQALQGIEVGDQFVVSDRADGVFEAKTGLTPNGYDIIAGQGATVNLEWVKAEPYNAVALGCDNTASADTTAALQNFINLCATDGVQGFLPAGEYLFTKLYCYYDAINNTGYPEKSSTGLGSVLIGSGAMTRQDWKNDTFVGTVLRTTDTTGNCFNFSEQGASTRGGHLSGMSFVGSTTGRLLNVDSSNAYTNIGNIFVGNDEAINGTGMYVSDVWESQFYDIDAVCNKNFVNGTPTYASGSKGIVFETTSAGGGNVLWKNITAAFCEDALTFGKDYDAGNSIAKGHMFINCQGQYSDNGITIKHGISHSEVLNMWCENNAVADVHVSDSAANIAFVGGTVSSDALTGGGNVVLGKSSGTAGEKAVYNCTLKQTRFGFCDVAGLRKHPEALDVVVDSCSFKNNGGVGVQVNSTEPAELTIINPNWYPDDAGSAIPESSQVNDGSSDARYLVRRGDIGRNNITADLDMSSWRYVPDYIRANTGSGDITLSLPTGSEYHGRIEAIKASAANNLIFDAGTGNTIRSQASPSGTQTVTLTANYSGLGLKHANDADSKWDTVNSF